MSPAISKQSFRRMSWSWRMDIATKDRADFRDNQLDSGVQGAGRAFQVEL